MTESSYREFDAVDPFGRNWRVQFRWLQNAISIRHADAIDLKYYLSNSEEGSREIVISLPHAPLLEACKKVEHPVTDGWCLRLSNRHLKEMIATWEDMDKTVVTLLPPDLDRHCRVMAEEYASQRELAAKTR